MKKLILLFIMVVFHQVGFAQQQMEVFSESGNIIDTSIEIPQLKKHNLINRIVYADDRIQPVPVDLSMFEKIQVGTNNPNAKMWLTVICDSYKNRAEAISTTTTIYNQFLATYPMSKYVSNYNCYVIWYAPINSGVKHARTAPDCTNYGVPQSDSTTLFLSQFDVGNIHRLLVAQDYTNLNLVFDNFGAQTGLKVVNIGTPFYGGSGGNFSCVAGKNYSSAEIFIHEYGHSFAGLRDEYCGGSCSIGADGINVTRAATLALAPWANVPGTGLMVGAYYCCDGTWKRPCMDCKMNHLNVPFCVVCSNAIEAKILSIIGSVVQPQPPVVTSHNYTLDLNTSNSINLTANGAATYLWMPAAGLQTTTGSTVVCVATITTTYTISGTATNGLSDTAISKVTVIPKVVIVVDSCNVDSFTANCTAVKRINIRFKKCLKSGVTYTYFVTRYSLAGIQESQLTQKTLNNKIDSNGYITGYLDISVSNKYYDVYYQTAGKCAKKSKVIRVKTL